MDPSDKSSSSESSVESNTMLPEVDSLRTNLRLKDLRLLTLSSTFHQASGPIRSFTETRACGKVILAGEHAVVYGSSAIAMPLLSKHVQLKMYADPHLSASPKVRFNLGDKPATDALKLMVIEAFDVLSIPRFNLSLEGQSSLMLGAGVGSSASLCVSVLRGLAQLTGRSLTPLELAKCANQLERRFHGNPSGLDTAVVSLEKVIFFKRDHEPKPISVVRPQGSRFPWTFVLIDSSHRASTINMVKLAEPVFLERGNGFVREFDDVTELCKDALENGKLSRLKEAMNHSHLLLTEIGVVTPALHEIYKTAMGLGALACKVTGAGGGGCVLSLLDAEQCDSQIAKLREVFGNDRIHPMFIP